MSDTHDVIVERLASLMASVSPVLAAGMAEDLTARINANLAAAAMDQTFNPMEGLTAIMAHVLPAHLMNFATLDVPWTAFRRAHIPHGAPALTKTLAPRLVCSVPESLANLARSRDRTPIWAGSLLDALGLVLEGAREEVLLMNPYWSALGVESLLRHVPRESFAGVCVTIMTQPRLRLDAAMRDGIDLFVSTLERMGAICKVLTPSKNLKPIPLLHAKAIVADRSTGYMGSANLTGNGMDLSVELGMAFDGPLARQLANWMISLGDALVDSRD